MNARHRGLLAIAALVAASVLGAAPAAASSFSCQAAANDGGPGILLQTTSEFGCSRSAIIPGAAAQTSASPGSLHAATEAFSSQNAHGASAVVEARDRFTVAGLGAGGAFLQFSMMVEGLLLANNDDQSAGTSGFTADAVMFTTSEFDRARVTGCYTNPAANSVVSVCNGAFDFTGDQPILALFQLGIHANNGDVIHLNLRFDTYAYAYAPYTSAMGQSLFLNSFEWLGLEQTAETANLVLTSESGFDYRHSAIPDVGAGVPEPTIWALMILGFGAAGAMLRRRGVPTA